MRLRLLLPTILTLLMSLPALADADRPPRPKTVQPQETGSTWSIGPYVYDGSGNIKSIGRSDGTRDVFVYDAFGRLTRGTAGSGKQQDYTYDELGNLLTITTDGETANRINLGVDPSTNRISRQADPTTGEPYNAYGTFDSAGNMTTSAVGDSFVYDGVGALKESTVGGTRKVYLYTANDERIAAITVVNNVKYDAVWALRDPAGAVLRRYYESPSGTWSWREDYIYREGELLAAEVNAPEKTLHFFLDHLGSPRLITGHGGAEFVRRTYYPFGRETAPAYYDYEVMGFTGHERDSADFTYMHQRTQMAAWGRFLSPDALGLGNLLASGSWNRYAYVLNDPLNSIDPYGLLELRVIKGGAGTLTCINGACSLDITVTARDPEAESWREFELQMLMMWLRNPVESVGRLRNPVTGMTAAEHWRVSGRGLAAFADGAIPDLPFCPETVCDPLLSNGVYDVNEPGMRFAQVAGVPTGEVGTAVIGGQLIRVFELGKNGRLFAQGTGYFNKVFGNKLRIGWGGAKGRSSPFFRIVFGAKRAPLPYLRHIDFW